MGYQNKSSIRLCDYKNIFLLPEEIAEAETNAKAAPEESIADTRRYFLQTAYIEKVVKTSKIKVSEQEAKERGKQMVRALDQQLANSGEELEKYYEETKTTEKELLADFTAEAERQLRTRMALYEIAKDQDLLATSEEYDAEVRRLSERSLLSVERLRKLFEEEEEAKIRYDIAVSKGAEYIGQLIDAKYPLGNAGK